MKKIVILGGGTAGWMAANLLNLHLAKAGFSTTVVESPDIGIIGVGEGSTPHLKLFFQALQLQESDWMPQCHATFKNGISFKNWSSIDGYREYFHPFPSMPDRQTGGGFLINTMKKRHGHDVVASPNPFFLSAHLAEQDLSPKTKANFPISINYGYHFDSAKLGEYLRDVATQRGVIHIQGNVQQSILTPEGEISALVTETGEKINGDLFVDCSGFKSQLLQQALGVDFVSFKDNLFNDSAVAIPSQRKGSVGSQTISTALTNGWSWDIPLTNRTGNGYVYSSDYISAEKAESELREKLAMTDSDVEAKHLKMKVGRVAKHWFKNCLAVGLSQGFIEPLEATALHLVQETLESFISAFQAGGLTNQHQDEFNQRINARFEGIRDYIVCHYKVNSRTDSQYWLDNQHNQNLSDSLKHILDVWDKGGDLVKELDRQNIASYYPALSWHCLLAGYGRFPRIQPVVKPTHEVSMAEIQTYIQKCAQGFYSHEHALNALREQTQQQ